MISCTPNNVGIFYYGGSGGFFALHLILLSNVYKCVFKGLDQDFENIFDRQWNITVQAAWKKHETWPSNLLTQSSSFTNKIFFYCDPTYDEFYNFDGKKIVVYTDFETQFALSKAKNAYFFNKQDVVNESLSQSFTAFYNTVRDPSWPDCSSISDFYLLPSVIQAECIDVHGGLSCVDYNEHEKILKQQLSLPLSDSLTVDKKLLTTIDINDADYAVMLQQMIATSGKVLYDKLNLVYNKRCKHFTNHYLSLHTLEQQQLLKTLKW
jgi:hypothetical protein